MKNLYKRFAHAITDHYVDKKTIDSSKIEVYSYGFEVLISTCVYVTALVLVSAITNTFVSSMFFLIGFFIVRTIAGGYHAKTYLQCHILFETTHLIYIIVVKILPWSWIHYTSTMLFCISAIILLICSPIDHPNKPFTEREKKRFKMISCIYAFIIVIIYSVLVSIDQRIVGNNSLSFAVGTITATISLMIAKIKLRR